MVASGPDVDKGKIANFKESLENAKKSKEFKNGIKATIEKNEYLLVSPKEIEIILEFCQNPELSGKLLYVEPGQTLRLSRKEYPQLPRTLNIVNKDGQLRLIIETKSKHVDKDGNAVPLPDNIKRMLTKGGTYKRGKPMWWVNEDGNFKQGFNLVLKPENQKQKNAAIEEARTSQKIGEQFASVMTISTEFRKPKTKDDVKAAVAHAKIEAEAGSSAAAQVKEDDEIDISGIGDVEEEGLTFPEFPESSPESASLGDAQVSPPSPPESPRPSDVSESLQEQEGVDLSNIDNDDDEEEIIFNESPSSLPESPRPGDVSESLQEQEQVQVQEQEQVQLSLYDFEKADTDLLEYIDNIEKNKLTLTKDIQNKLILNILECIKAMHDKGLVHQDIKLQNFLVYHDKDGIRVKVADFGTTREITKEPKDASISTKAIGSPELAIPGTLGGQIAIRNNIKFNFKEDKAHDMWALGLLCLQIKRGTTSLPTIDKPSMDKFESSILEDPLLKGLLAAEGVKRFTIDQAIDLQRKQMGLSSDREIKERSAAAAAAAAAAPISRDAEVKQHIADVRTPSSPLKSSISPPPIVRRFYASIESEKAERIKRMETERKERMAAEKTVKTDPKSQQPPSNKKPDQ